jgi:hypothetical protein
MKQSSKRDEHPKCFGAQTQVSLYHSFQDFTTVLYLGISYIPVLISRYPGLFIYDEVPIPVKSLIINTFNKAGFRALFRRTLAREFSLIVFFGTVNNIDW